VLLYLEKSEHQKQDLRRKGGKKAATYLYNGRRRNQGRAEVLGFESRKEKGKEYLLI